jgi:hypothetical protein
VTGGAVLTEPVQLPSHLTFVEKIAVSKLGGHAYLLSTMDQLRDAVEKQLDELEKLVC